MTDVKELMKYDARERAIKHSKEEIHRKQAQIMELQDEIKRNEDFIELWSDDNKIRKYFEIPKENRIISSPQYFVVIHQEPEGKLWIAMQDVDGSMKQYPYDILK